MPMSRRHGGMLVMSAPSIVTVPLCAWLKPAINLSSVDLPQPEGPSNAKNSPGSTVRLMSRSTCVAPNARFTFRMSTLTLGPVTAGCSIFKLRF